MEQLGKVIAVPPGYLVVATGFVFPTDSYLPTTAVANAKGDGISLIVSKDAALSQGWEVESTVADDSGLTSTIGMEPFEPPAATFRETVRDARRRVSSRAGLGG